MGDVMEDRQFIQVLRTLDKFDRLGVEGVIELLQKPFEEFGAGLDPIRAEFFGRFASCADGSSSNEETLARMKEMMDLAHVVNRRIQLMTALDEAVDPNTGETAWEKLIAMKPNSDETWSDGGRPDNIFLALDDIAQLGARLIGLPEHDPEGHDD